MEQQSPLNARNKQEEPRMHTTEHIVNRTMINFWGCERAVSAHIERKKSKLDFAIDHHPTDNDILNIEEKVNDIISWHLPVSAEFIDKTDAAKQFDLKRLPENASETLRIVNIGNYDACPCIGSHVKNTSEIGVFKITSHDYNHGILRIRFKLI